MPRYFIHQTVAFLMFKGKGCLSFGAKILHTLSEGLTAAHVIHNDPLL